MTDTALTSDSKEATTKHDEDGNLLVRGNCKVCKKCWIYLTPPHRAGKCLYDGPFSGLEKQEEAKHKGDKA